MIGSKQSGFLWHSCTKSCDVPHLPNHLTQACAMPTVLTSEHGMPPKAGHERCHGNPETVEFFSFRGPAVPSIMITLSSCFLAGRTGPSSNSL